jgi:hypothetical protein
LAIRILQGFGISVMAVDISPYQQGRVLAFDGEDRSKVKSHEPPSSKLMLPTAGKALSHGDIPQKVLFRQR